MTDMTILTVVCHVCLSVTLVYCGQTVRWIKTKLGMQVQFLAHICCGQMAGWIKMPLGRKVDLGLSDIVLDGTQLLLPQKGGRVPQLSAHVYCGQTAAWIIIKMPLGMELGLGPGHIVLHGTQYPQKGAQRPPNF